MTQAIKATKDRCPTCKESTSIVKLGGNPAKEICGRFGCDWAGNKLE